MNRAAHRRDQKAAAKRAAKATEGFAQKPDQWINLVNPVADHFGAFIVGNAQYCEHVVEQDSAKGQHLVICGAGPSLAETAAEWCPKGDQVWGCNSAAMWLHREGHKVTHAFTVDQTPAMLNEWRSPPDLEYLVASTIHPHLTEMLRAAGRRLTWFHNFVGIRKPPVQYGVCRDCNAALPTPEGIEVACPHATVETRIEPYEDWLYLALWPPTIRAGSGLNASTRAIDVGLFMGFEHITLLGADCCLRLKTPSPNAPHGSKEHMDWLQHETVMHADGGSALASGATPVTLGGVIDGKHYETKPDLAISAVWLEVMRRKLKGRLTIEGDGLAAALKDKPASFLARLPALVDSSGKPIEIVVED